ncbi:MAG TPA: thiamine diphosphokinase [Thermotogota bacterium]|nr:thiamine diphosphokinase [Thermotogota bacterium]
MGKSVAEKRKGLVVCGADQSRSISPREADFIGRYDYLVAVDGGLRCLKDLDLVPDLWIGDGDSVSESDIAWACRNRTKIHLFPFSKNYLDSELAIRAISESCSEIGLSGVWGSRPDQSFSTVSLLLLTEGFGMIAEAFLTTQGTETIMGICRGPVERVFQSAPRDRWSFIALTECHGVTLIGFDYGLKGESVFRDQTRTISNRATADNVRIKIESGDLLYFHLLDGADEG